MLLTGKDLTLDEVVAVARDGRPVELTEEAVEAMSAASSLADHIFERGLPTYGLTTGLGAQKRTSLRRDDDAFSRRQIAESHVGHGPDAPRDVVRATMLVLLNQYAGGSTCVRPVIAERLVEALNAGETPRVRMLGSLGASDLAPMAELASWVRLEIPVGTSPGNQEFTQLEQYAGFLPAGLVIPSGLYPPHAGVFVLDRRVEDVQRNMESLLAAAHQKADNATGTSWDPALIVISALRALGPDATAAQIKDYIANLTGFPGINGLYNFKKVPQRGLDAQNAVIVRYDAEKKQWVWLSKPGGIPLSR